MVKRQIQLRILKDGSVELSVLNGQGADCLDLTDALEKGIGTTTNRQMKPEFYESARNSQNLGEPT